MGKERLSLQMYTLRDQLAEDFRGTFARVAEMGYPAVELAGFGGKSADEVDSILKGCGLKASGSHVGIEQLEADLERVIAEQEAVGNSYVVIPYLTEERRKTSADWRSLASAMNDFGAALAEKDLKLAYHNHSFEFERFDGEYGLDILFGATDAARVLAEVDTYWVQHGGEDPAAYISKLGARAKLIHLKDMTPGPEPTFAEVGKGILDWDKVLEASGKVGAEWYIVEQDTCAGDPLVSVRTSLEYLTSRPEFAG